MMNKYSNIVKLIAVFLQIITVQSRLSAEEKSKSKEEAKKPAPNVIFKFSEHGVGSNLIQMIRHKQWYEDHGYRFKAYEHTSRYRYKGESMLQTFFSPKFEVVKNENRLNYLLSDPSSFYEDWLHKGKLINVEYPKVGLEAFKWHSKQFCQSLKFNIKAEAMFRAFKRKRRFPLDYEKVLTVGFHVRRGDKLNGESRKFDAKEYVDKMLKLDIKKEDVKYCLVASDDFAAVSEMRFALKEKGVKCTVVSLGKKSETGNTVFGELEDEDILEFMAELQTLMQSTYFIGSFNSNVGRVVALLRSCYKSDEANLYNSFGVDRDRYSG